MTHMDDLARFYRRRARRRAAVRASVDGALPLLAGRRAWNAGVPVTGDAATELLRKRMAEVLWGDDSGQSPETLWDRRPGTQRTYLRAAANLLPVVEAECRRRAAEELRAAADQLEPPNAPIAMRVVADRLRARADAIERRP